jgi:hypothetical protein
MMSCTYLQYISLFGILSLRESIHSRHESKRLLLMLHHLMQRVECQTSWLDVVVGGLRLAFRLSVWRDSGPSTCTYTGPLVPAILIRSRCLTWNNELNRVHTQSTSTRMNLDNMECLLFARPRGA